MPNGLFRNTSKNRWRCRLRFPDGTVRSVSTGQRDYQAALAAKRRLEREAADPSYAPPSRTTLGEALAAFLACLDANGGHSRRGCRTATIRYYRYKAAALERQLGAGLELRQLRLERLEAYIRARRAAGAVDHTIAKELGVLRATLRRAQREGTWRGDVAELFPAFRAGYTPRVRHLTPEELERLVAVLSPGRGLIVRLIVLSGARNGEWERLAREDVAGDVLTLPGTKTEGARRRIPIHPELGRVLAAGAGEGKLFPRWPNIRRDLAAACRRAGVARVTPNDLRRTYATWLWKGGMPPAEIARLLGHADSRMVERVYGQLRAEDLAGKVAKVFEAIAAAREVARG